MVHHHEFLHCMPSLWWILEKGAVWDGLRGNLGGPRRLSNSCTRFEQTNQGLLRGCLGTLQRGRIAAASRGAIP